MTFWMAVLVLTAFTYLTRSVFILTLADRQLPDLITTALRYVAPATLAAFVASLLVGEEGVTGLAPSPEVFALVVSGLVAWKWQSTVLTMCIGMGALWLALATT